MLTTTTAAPPAAARLADVAARAFLLAYGIREALATGHASPEYEAAAAGCTAWQLAAERAGLPAGRPLHDAARAAAAYLSAAPAPPRPFAQHGPGQLVTMARQARAAITWHTDPRHLDTHAAAVHLQTVADVAAEQRHRAAS